MLKKIIIGAALFASSSFATYSQFPVPQANSGEVKLVGDFTTQDKWKGLDLSLKGRFVPVQNLELFLNLPFAVITRWDGKDTDNERMKNLTFGGRYQILPNVAAFLDVTFPTGKKHQDDDGFGFYFGGQYSQDFGSVALGTEIGLGLTTEGDDKYNGPMTLTLIAEIDPNVSPNVSPYVGLTLNILLNDPKSDGHKAGDTSGDVGISPYAGATVKMNNILSVDFSASVTFGKDYLIYTCDGNDKLPVTLSAALITNF
ncbi:MAG: hypothetical protein IJM92_06645 [Fibrobacter sp.]|uniref:hypothetical protein n=1 Tax=Fibrobacter sp. TaxID=35828 RepID=UPI0025BECD94|nr:hypothetical protein [Fibrobacter sp.]MBQ7079332.1 hypothetical protein [Fibrobacter sp.]